MSKPLVVILLLLSIFGVVFLINPSSEKESVETNTKIEQKMSLKASFAIFTNGTLRDFSDSRYHNQSEDVFIEPENPMVVNVRKEGITWDGFFKTLPMKLTKECLTTGTGQVFCNNEGGTLKFYLNESLDDNSLSRSISNNDKLLISFGDESESEIKQQLKLLE